MALKKLFEDINSKTDYDNIEVASKDAQGNPTELRYFKDGKRVLRVYVTYDSNGDFQNLHTKAEKGEKEKDQETYYQ